MLTLCVRKLSTESFSQNILTILIYWNAICKSNIYLITIASNNQNIYLQLDRLSALVSEAAAAVTTTTKQQQQQK